MTSFDVASGGPSWHYMNDYESENTVFSFCSVIALVEKNTSMLSGKFMWRSWTAHIWLQSPFLAHSETASEKIWYRKNEKLFYDQHMPVILHKEDEAMWLNPDITESEHLQPLLTPYAPVDEMEGWPVSDAAKNPRNDYPDLIKPVDKKITISAS